MVAAANRGNSSRTPRRDPPGSQSEAESTRQRDAALGTQSNGWNGLAHGDENVRTPANRSLTGVLGERMTRFELATLTLAR